MSFLADLTKGLSTVQSLIPFVNSTVVSVESLLSGAPGSVKKAAAMQIIGSGLTVAAAASGAPAELVSTALTAVSPLIDSIVALKNAFGEFAQPSPVTASTPAAAPAAASGPASAAAQAAA